LPTKFSRNDIPAHKTLKTFNLLQTRHSEALKPRLALKSHHRPLQLIQQLAFPRPLTRRRTAEPLERIHHPLHLAPLPVLGAYTPIPTGVRPSVDDLGGQVWVFLARVGEGFLVPREHVRSLDPCEPCPYLPRTEEEVDARRGGWQGMEVRDHPRDAAAEVTEAAGGRDGFRETGVEAALEGG
jgi:hypothetical protein